MAKFTICFRETNLDIKKSSFWKSVLKSRLHSIAGVDVGVTRHEMSTYLPVFLPFLTDDVLFHRVVPFLLPVAPAVPTAAASIRATCRGGRGLADRAVFNNRAVLVGLLRHLGAACCRELSRHTHATTLRDDLYRDLAKLRREGPATLHGTVPRERTGAETEAEERTSLLVAPPHGGGGGGGGHTGAVIALAACGDGRVVSGSDDMTIKVWNTGCEDRAGGRAGDMGDAGAGGGAWELEQTLTDHTGFVVVLAVLYSDGGSGGGSDGGDTRSGGSGSGGGGGGGDGSLAGIIGEGGGVCEALFKFDSSGNDHEDEDNSGGNCSGNSSGKNKHRDLRRPRRILCSGSFDATIKAWSDDINPWSDAAGSGGGAGAGAGGGGGAR